MATNLDDLQICPNTYQHGPITVLAVGTTYRFYIKNTELLKQEFPSQNRTTQREILRLITELSQQAAILQEIQTPNTQFQILTDEASWNLAEKKDPQLYLTSPILTIRIQENQLQIIRKGYPTHQTIHTEDLNNPQSIPNTKNKTQHIETQLTKLLQVE